VLDTALGRPAEGIDVHLEQSDGASGFREIARGRTNADGRIAELLAPGALAAGTYRLTFDVAGYFERTSRPSFYPEVSVTFTIEKPDEHYHVPLLLSPYGYSTYRGS
jgi:5-hydroxyisourate hydrolase